MNLNIYYFIDEFNKNEIEKLSSKISLIYRNYGKKSDSIELKKLILYCKNKRRKIYISNDLKTAIRSDKKLTAVISLSPLLSIPQVKSPMPPPK